MTASGAAASTTRVRDGIGTSPVRPDGRLKVEGRFAFSSDLHHDDMVWGATVRSPHPSARIVDVDVSAAVAHPEAIAVLTAQDVPGENRFGLIERDQPVLAADEVRYVGEPVAVVAAKTPSAAKSVAAAVRVVYEPLEPVTDPATALDPGVRAVLGTDNLLRRVTILRGVSSPEAPIVVSGTYEIGMQDQAALGTESGLALVREDGDLELYVATQWLHGDLEQLADVMAMPAARLHVTLAGVGGAFGAKEDLSVQAHLCLLALRTGRPVKMVYDRLESFLGHVHRHPARLELEHGVDHDGTLRYVRCRGYVDGGPYASTSPVVASNVAAFAVGPYRCPTVDIVVDARITNNPPAGAMRGFGAVQAAFAHESQMDRIAASLDIDPLELRRRNALVPGDPLPTGQSVRACEPVLPLLERLAGLPPPAPDPGSDGSFPGGAGNVTRGEGLVRGVGWAIGFKNGGMPEGTVDRSAARVGLRAESGRVVAQVQTAAAELGQGLVTVQEQIVRELLGVERVVTLPADTTVASAGTSSASRQTYLTGGAVEQACLAVRSVLIARAGSSGDPTGWTLVDEHLVAPTGERWPLTALVSDEPVVEERTFTAAATQPLDAGTGQGDAHLQLLFCAHRAVVDVDVDTGLVRVVELTAVQDVGRAMNPTAVVGQIDGASTQGLGLALMEELQVDGGRLVNPSFADYLIPTTLDVPDLRSEVLQIPDDRAPFGVKGAGEPGTLSSTPAIVAAIRAATGRSLNRVPVRPHDLVIDHERPEPGR